MKVYCDESVLVEAVEGTGEPAGGLEAIFDAADRHGVTFVTSTLSLSALLIKPIQRRNHRLVAAYTHLLSNARERQLRAVDIDRSILAHAAFVRLRKADIRLPDAIHIATAEHTGCSRILTRDSRWMGSTDIPILDVDSAALASLLERAQ